MLQVLTLPIGSDTAFDSSGVRFLQSRLQIVSLADQASQLSEILMDLNAAKRGSEPIVEVGQSFSREQIARNIRKQNHISPVS